MSTQAAASIDGTVNRGAKPYYDHQQSGLRDTGWKVPQAGHTKMSV